MPVNWKTLQVELLHVKDFQRQVYQWKRFVTYNSTRMCFQRAGKEHMAQKHKDEWEVGETKLRFITAQRK